MLYSWLIVLAGLIAISSSSDGDHDGHQHTDEDVPDCSCTTGITTEDLDCDDAEDTISDLQEYLEDESCSQYCSNLEYIGTTEEAFICLQAFSLLAQYHDYCETGTVDEELFHDYLEVCPDCRQEHYYVEGAVECSGHLDCDDTDAQEAEVKNVLHNCTDTETCADGCVESWRIVEGYHRMCDHHDLSESFDELFDQLDEDATACTNISCNVPWEEDYMANCSSDANMDYSDLLADYGPIDVEEIHEHDHESHQHDDDSVPDCSCTTGFSTDDLDCDEDDEVIENLQEYLADNECSKYCFNFTYIGTTEEAFTCFQAFSLLVQYHDRCETGSIDEELFHDYLEVCPDCKQEHYYVEGAVECDGELDCDDTDAQEAEVKNVLANCTDTETCADGCVESWRKVETYHRACAHTDLSESFDELFEQLDEDATACTNISCNVPWEEDYTANCSSPANKFYMMLLDTYDTLDLDDIDDDHDGHQHSDDSVADCSCITGITTEKLDCDNAETELEDLQTYLKDNDCDGYCHDEHFHDDGEESFTCFQVFALVLQYHDYCETGTVDEELVHEYLEVCPDCRQEHYYVEGAIECDGDLDCEDTVGQDEDVEFVFNNCDAAECGDETNDDGEGCVTVWRRVEGYHRMCDHHDLSEEFDKLYDEGFGETACTNISCNVPWEEDYVANCSSSANSEYTSLLDTYGPLDTSDIVNDPSKANQIISIPVIAIVAILSFAFI